MTSLLLTLIIAAQLGQAADVELVLYSDFQCPFCAQLAPAIRELQGKGTDLVHTSVRFKNFPLSIHPNARLAHQAAMAAREQGKFWEMHDLLFANPSKVKREDLLGYAKKLDLDLDRFTKDMDSDRIKQLVEADMVEGEKIGVNATPTFTINGKAYSGTRSFDQLKQLIEGQQLRTRALAEITENLLSKGPAEAPVVLEFFADLQSPVSAPALEVLDALMRQYPSKVRVQFRNFPLAFHPHAALAHEAAMTAARDGRFWDFAAFVLSRQDSLREQELISFAGQLGIDQTKFAETMRQHRYAARVEADVETGFGRGIRGSPTVLIGTRRIDGVPSLQALMEYVKEELAAQATNTRSKP